MKGKKARKPVEPVEREAVTAEDVFGSPPERELQPEASAYDDSGSDDIVAATLGVLIPRETAGSDPPRAAYGTGPGPDTVDGYVRSQVLREMYGTDSPSDYDKMQLALRKML